MQKDESPKIAIDEKVVTQKSSPNLRDYVKTSLVDLVARQIRAEIFSGKYVSGQKLIVRELSESLGVSHTPVKDALNRLTAEGLIEAFPNRSMVVRTFSNEELIEIMAVRLMCEIFYAEEIVANAAEDPGVIEDMERAWQNMGELLEDKDSIDHEGWVALESVFHKRYISASTNNKLVHVYSTLDANRFTYFAYLCSNKSPLSLQTYETNMKEHRDIIDTLKAKDAEGFKRAVACHVTKACEKYVIDETTRNKVEQIKRLAVGYLPRAQASFLPGN